MTKAVAVMIGSLLSVSPALAQQSCPVANGGVPPGANTTDPSAPFYINIKGLTFNTSPPTRNPLNPAYPPATTLPNGQIPTATENGNFIIGPTHDPAPETTVNPNVPHGATYSFTMSSNQSVTYKPGWVRDDPNGCLDASVYTASTVPSDPSHIIITTSHTGTWTRTVTVYVPALHRFRGDAAPFIVTGDAGITFPTGTGLFTVLDNLIAAHKVPAMIAIEIGPGGQDAQGSERGREYDAISSDYALWVENEVLPMVENAANVKLTKDPNGRATLGISSSGAAAFTMAYYHPELYRRVLAYSPTLVNQQWPQSPGLPGGAWQFHSPYAGPPVPNENVEAFNPPVPSSLPTGTPLVVQSARLPIRFWFETGQQDLFYPDVSLADGMHDWVLANETMAIVLAAKGYQYQFIFSENAGHVDAATTEQTLPEALEWLWAGYERDHAF